MGDEVLARAAYLALKPEAERSPSDRFSVGVGLEGDVLVIRVVARDTSSLRAALNSYLSWLKAIKDVGAVVAP